jgi:hypothetical protein
MAEARYVRKDRRIYDDAHCLYCGSFHGICKGEERAHRVVRCMACDTPQCIGNGLARGTCSVCYIGLLPGWSGSDRTCSYAGCNEPAIARADGKNKYRCRKHLERGKWRGYVAKRIEERDVHWELARAAEVPTL